MPGIIKPKFIDPLGDRRFSALAVSPPFRFRNATARVFPIRANMSVLTSFCDQYLNMDIPPEIVHYSPALPYVYMMILNYGSMAAASVQAQNVGWVSQHEVTFSVPLQRWRLEDGEMVFKDWASVSPFIYVDDEFSLTNGREVYGWNKVAGKIDTSVPLWAGDPRARLRQFDLSVTDFGDAYAGDGLSHQSLLHVDLDPPPTFSEFPPDPRNPWSPLWIGPNAVASAATLLGSVVDTALSLNIRGFEPHRSVDSLVAMARKAGSKIKDVWPGLPPLRGSPGPSMNIDTSTGGMPRLFVDTVTMKQFRNPQNPELACYQALVNSPMGVERLNRCGLLGDINLLRGDISGGYSLRIHKFDTQPIVECLGLHVESWSDADAGAGIATLKPVLPFWLDVDLLYGKGKNICSRAPWGGIRPENGWNWVSEEDPEPAPEAKQNKRRTHETPPAAKVAASPTAAKATPTQAPQIPLYNTTLGAATQAIAGPFHFPDVTLQVYPLLSDVGKIREMITKHLNHPLNPGSDIPAGAGLEGATGWRFEPFGSYVYMMVTVYGDRLGDEWSAANNIGGFFGREVTFCVPVKWYDKDNKLISVAMIEPLTYSNSGRGVTTDREINGYNSIKATIESPEDIWLAPNGPVANRQYLSLVTEVIPALNVGQKAEQQTLIEIDERGVLPATEAMLWRDIADGWGREIIDELKRKTVLDSGGAQAEITYFNAPENGWPGDPPQNQVGTAKAMALELLAHREPFNRLIYKQYRDSNDFDSACYQALVKATSTITSIYDLREIESDVHVRFHRQPGHPIVSGFGLKVKTVESREGSVVDIVQPLRPFWMRIAMREDLAEIVCYRTEAAKGWHVVHPWFAPATSGAPDPFADPGPTAKATEAPYFRRPDGARVGGWLGNLKGDIAPQTGTAATRSLPADPAVQASLIAAFESESNGASLHNNLKDEAERWLRKSLVNQLSWIRSRISTNSELYAIFQDSKICATRTGKAVYDILNAPLSVCAIRAATEGYSIGELMRVRTAIHQAADKDMRAQFAPPRDAGDFRRAPQMKAHDEARWQKLKAEIDAIATAAPLSSRAASDRLITDFTADLHDMVFKLDVFFVNSSKAIPAASTVWAWQNIVETNRSIELLKNFLVNFDIMPPMKKQALLLSVPENAINMMLGIKDYIDKGGISSLEASQHTEKWSIDALMKFRNIIDEMRTFGEILEPIYLDWHYPYRWRRFFVDDDDCFHDASNMIERLDDVQMLIDNILSSEWENHGKTRWTNPKAGRKPDQYIKDGPDMRMCAAQQGLLRWQDPLTGQNSDLWISPVQGTPYQLPPQTPQRALRKSAGPKSAASKRGTASPRTTTVPKKP